MPKLKYNSTGCVPIVGRNTSSCLHRRSFTIDKRQFLLGQPGCSKASLAFSIGVSRIVITSLPSESVSGKRAKLHPVAASSQQ